MLVLQDGRDLAIAFLGSQEWNGMTQPLEDIGRMEMVRGPGSALYGANAFSGVVNITTPLAREVAGTKLTLAGGELETFKGDFRHAGVFGDDRFGYRINAGYNRSDTYSRSRTLRNGTSLQQEYDPATDEPVPPALETRPLNGQTTDPVTGAPLGDRAPLQNAYGSARLDYYMNNGAVLSADGGGAQVENEVFVTGIGRVQVLKAMKPYARVALAHDRYNIFGFWNSRTSIDPQYSLVSGLPLEERSDIFHLEGQQNWNFSQDRGRVIYGASYRNTRVNTSGTLMDPINDDRSDDYYSAYGQVEYRLIPQLRMVGAGRVDDGTLFKTQFSPKGALVFSPNESHSFRFSVNRAFQTPNYSEFFLQVPVAAPTAGPFTVESGIQNYYSRVQASLPPAALAGLTLHSTLPWDFSPQTQALALGNSDLKVETVLGWELGYKGSLSQALRHGRLLHQRPEGLRHRPAAGRQSGVSQLLPHRRRAERSPLTWRPWARGSISWRRVARSVPLRPPRFGRRFRCSRAAMPRWRPEPPSRAPTRSRRCPTAAVRSSSRTPIPER